MTDKIDKNEAKPLDYAQVAISSIQILAAVGVLAELANPWTLVATGLVGGAVAAYGFYEMEFLKVVPLSIKNGKSITAMANTTSTIL